MQVNGNSKQGPGVIQMYDGTVYGKLSQLGAVMGTLLKRTQRQQPDK
jgi:hypothetical protein